MRRSGAPFEQLKSEWGVRTDDIDSLLCKLMLAQLRSMHCQSGQGYLFSKPADAAVVEQLLTGTNMHLVAPAPALSEDTHVVQSEMIA